MADLKKSHSNLVNALIYIVLGVLFCVFKASTLEWMLTIAGIVFIVLGVLDLVKKEYISGAVSIGIGAIIILCGWLFVEIVLIVFGVLLAIKGGLAMIDAVKGKSIVDIVFAGITIAAGIMLIISKWALIDWFFIIIGIILIVNGALELVGKELKNLIKK